MGRRTVMQGGLSAALSAVGACRAATAPLRSNGIPTCQLGAITGNDPKLMTEWRGWLGRAEDHDVL